MELTLTQAATLVGVSPLTLRDRLARGDVPGAKRGGRWHVDSHGLPLSESQRRSMQARADEIRSVVEARTARGDRSRTIPRPQAIPVARKAMAASRT